MITVAEINIAPVKSMALVPLESVNLELGGIQDDRRFYLVNQHGRLLTRRQVGKLAQLSTSWDAGAEQLTIRFPDGTALEGKPELDRPVWTIVWGQTGARPGVARRLDESHQRVLRSAGDVDDVGPAVPGF